MRQIKHVALVASLVLSVALLVGCPQTGPQTPAPSFTPGATASEFGLANDNQGNTYRVTTLANGDVEVRALGDKGNVAFIVDGQGRLTGATGPAGSTIELAHNADGSIDVSGVVLIDGQAEPFTGTIPAGTLPAGKSLTAQGNDPLIVCVAIQAFCDLLPGLLDSIIGILAAELGNELGLPISADAFPTGFAAIDNQVRQIVRERFPIITQLEGFCTVWELLDLDDFCASA